MIESSGGAPGGGRGVEAVDRPRGAGNGASIVRRYAHGSRVPGWDAAVDLEKDPLEVPDPATTPVPDEVRAGIEVSMARYPDRHSAVLDALHLVQRRYGWCSPEAVDQVACVMRVTPAFIDSIASFYDMFVQEPRPVDCTDVYVCTNISCSLRGADELLSELQRATGDDPAWSVRGFECLGACDMAPMASVNGVYVGPLDLRADVAELLEDVRAGRPVLRTKQVAVRATTDREADEGGR